MKILADQIEKKFRQEFVIKNFSFSFSSGSQYAIIGSNGSGKSTLLKILSQQALPTKGKVTFVNELIDIPQEDCFKSISFAAPYSELIEEFTLTELIEFLKESNYLPDEITNPFFEDYIELKTSKQKYIKNFSSGMRQKVKLGIAFVSKRPILLLDEPTSNLDFNAKIWFKEKLQLQQEKLVIIASNEAFEIENCHEKISMLDFK